MKRLLLIVDYQKDFVDGALSFPGTEVLDGSIVAKIVAYRVVGGGVASILGIHDLDYLGTQGGRKSLTPYCLLNSEGQQLYGQTGQVMECGRNMAIGEDAFPSLWLVNRLKEQGYDWVELVGLVPYPYVLSNAIMIKAALLKAEIMVDTSRAAGLDPASHARDLDVTEALQITILNR